MSAPEVLDQCLMTPEFVAAFRDLTARGRELAAFLAESETVIYGRDHFRCKTDAERDRAKQFTALAEAQVAAITAAEKQMKAEFDRYHVRRGAAATREALKR